MDKISTADDQDPLIPELSQLLPNGKIQFGRLVVVQAELKYRDIRFREKVPEH